MINTKTFKDNPKQFKFFCLQITIKLTQMKLKTKIINKVLKNKSR